MQQPLPIRPFITVAGIVVALKYSFLQRHWHAKFGLRLSQDFAANPREQNFSLRHR